MQHQFRQIYPLIFFCLINFSSMNAQFFTKDQPFAHTYSIVAYDPVTGEMGVAVQSHWFSVGTIVSWAEAGVGAVATQSFSNPAFGPDGLAMIKSGMSAQDVLDSLIRSDDGREVRQLAIVDNQGNVAAWTGNDCIPAAGHLVGEYFAVQANLMLNDQVWPAMKTAYESAGGSLEEKMLAAMEAAQSVGGDIRGQQSAAMLVVKKRATGNLWIDRKTDIRIDDHPEPVKELRRIYNVKRAYDYMNEGDVAMEQDSMGKALDLYAQALELYPDNPEVKFWTAVTLTLADQLETALPLYREAFKASDNWKEVLKRIFGTDLFKVEQAVYERILSIED